MAQRDLDQLVDLWNTDAEFRAKMRDDPEGTVRSHAVQLSDDELQALRAVDWSASDEELGARISKAGGGAC